MLIGATYQGIATALERRQFPRPGGMVDVGGHQLHIYCEGAGGPTVVLEAPAAGMSSAWGWVQPQVAPMTRVCSYDRAGLGWSEGADGPYDPAAAATELQALLDHAGEGGPNVIVGHGLGAAFATLYASRFGANTLALILVDPPDSADSGDRRRAVHLSRASPWLARVGVLRATHVLSKNAAGLPEPSGGALAAFLNWPDHLTRAVEELTYWDQIVAHAGAAPLRPHIKVARMYVAGNEPVAFLTSRSAAAPVVTAIINAIGRIPGRADSRNP